MKARPIPAASPERPPKIHQTGLESDPHKKISKMKVAPRILMKTTGLKKCSSVVYENKGVISFSSRILLSI
jgi:hypothetical protein